MNRPNFNNPPVIPGVELYGFHDLPHDPSELPSDRNIPTRQIEGTEVMRNTVVHYTLEIPEEIIDPVPLGVAHGWFGFQSSYSQLRSWVARNGKPAVTVEPTRKLKNGAGYHPDHLLHPEKLLCQTMYGALKGIRKQREAEQAGIDVSQGDIFAHSMGGRTAAYVASRRPDVVRSVTFVAAAGLEPHSVPTFLVNRLPNFLMREVPRVLQDGYLQPYLTPAAARELASYAIGGGLRALREGVSIGNANIIDMLPQLGALGVKTALLEYEADTLIPAVRSLRHTGDKVNLAALFPYQHVGHLGPQTHPEATGAAQLEILDALNGTNLRQRERSTPSTYTRPQYRKAA